MRTYIYVSKDGLFREWHSGDRPRCRELRLTPLHFLSVSADTDPASLPFPPIWMREYFAGSIVADSSWLNILYVASNLLRLFERYGRIEPGDEDELRAALKELADEALSTWFNAQGNLEETA